MPRQRRQRLKLRRVHFPWVQRGGTWVRELVDAAAAGVHNGAKVEKLRAGRRRVSHFPGGGGASAGGGFAGEETDAAVGSEGFFVGGVVFAAAAAVDESGESDDSGGASDGGDGDGEEFFGGRFGLLGLGEDEGGDVSRERSKS